MEATQQALRGKELLRAAVNQIIQHPETWEQELWHCGTSHCVGGWCQILGGKFVDDDTMGEGADEMVGLSEKEGDYLFDCDRTLLEIYLFSVAFINDVRPIRGKSEEFPLL